MNTEYVSQPLSAERESQEEQPKSPKFEDSNSPFLGFNTEEFLARVNRDERINSILRSPTRPPNSVRQRSVYTAVTAVPPRASSGNPNNDNTTTKESSSTARQTMPFPMLSSTTATTMTSRSASANAYNARYAVTPQSPSDTYAYNNDGMSSNSSPNHHAKQFPQPMPPPPFAMSRLSGSRRGSPIYDNPTPPPCPGVGPIAMMNGTIQLRLRDGVRIDMTLDKAVRILNQRSMVAIALSRNCNNSAIIHPNGRILQSGSKVEIVTYDGMKNNTYVRYAKMWYKGISFTSESCALIYLVDTAGTRTTTDTFTDLSKDYTLTVFYDDSRHGPSYVQEVNEVIEKSSYSSTDDGTDIYEINGFRITQAVDGLVKVTRTQNKCLIRTSPVNGSATLTTPGIHCTASLGKTSHLFVRRNEKRMHFDGSCFIVRNAGHSAGFNENNLLIVY